MFPIFFVFTNHFGITCSKHVKQELFVNLYGRKISETSSYKLLTVMYMMLDFLIYEQNNPEVSMGDFFYANRIEENYSLLFDT